MTITTVSSRELNQDVGGAKKAAKNGPVFITDRGRPSHVLLTIETYRHITGKRGGMVELLAMDDGDFEFEPPRLSGNLYKPADFS